MIYIHVYRSMRTLLLITLLFSWWRHQMEAFSALLAICAGNSPVSADFPAQRPVTRGFDVFFDLCLNKRLSKQSWGWWFETLPCSIWRQSNVWLNLLMAMVRYWGGCKICFCVSSTPFATEQGVYSFCLCSCIANSCIINKTAVGSNVGDPSPHSSQTIYILYIHVKFCWDCS